MLVLGLIQEILTIQAMRYSHKKPSLAVVWSHWRCKTFNVNALKSSGMTSILPRLVSSCPHDKLIVFLLKANLTFGNPPYTQRFFGGVFYLRKFSCVTIIRFNFPSGLYNMFAAWWEKHSWLGQHIIDSAQHLTNAWWCPSFVQVSIHICASSIRHFSYSK